MLKAQGLTKSYGGAVALSNVDFEVGPGEIVGLIGENGAGKSTMIKILAGLVRQDSGSIFIDGKPVSLNTPSDATACGIAFIHQERHVLDNLDVAGNVLLGAEPKKYGFLLDRAAMQRRAKEALEEIGFDISPAMSAATLSNAQRQLVEIARAFTFDARMIIMDEPTSSLSSGETERLLELIRGLKTKGRSVVFVTHRLEEIRLVADRVVALRDGKYAGTLVGEQIQPREMVKLMVGRDIERTKPNYLAPGEVRLSVQKLRTVRYPQHEVSFDIRAGEVVGVAGLVGAGRSEVARAIFGVDPIEGGEVLMDGKPLVSGSPRAAIDASVFLVPEDRRREGVILTMSVLGNTTLPKLEQFSSMNLISGRKEAVYAVEMRDKLRIKADRLTMDTGSLSGGNQQKVALAKWLGLHPKCLLMDEPTVGIDVGARAEIYRLIRELAEEGVAILMFSSDLEEVLQLSDRVLVMHEGRLAGEIPGAEASEASIMNMAVGHAQSA